MTRRRVRLNNRGILLISSYLVLSLFLVYSSAMTMRTTTQRMVTDRLRERFEASDLAQGALEQIREDLYTFFASNVYQLRYQGNAAVAMQWLDNVGLALRGAAIVLDPAFDLSSMSMTGVVTGNTPLSQASARQVFLPIMGGQTGIGQAWITDVCVDPAQEGAVIDCLPDTNQFAPRNVTIEAMAQVGGVTKRIRATYQFALGMSNIFNYGYFINNYGWLDAGGGRIRIYGEVRANGDLDFTGDLSDLLLNGDAYAAANPELINPITGLPATGDITGDPTQSSSWTNYWNNKPTRARPSRRVSSSTQPAIGGTPTMLPGSEGWDSDDPQQSFYENQAVQDMPYLGDLDLYRGLAQGHNAGAGSTLTYNVDSNGDGIYGGSGDARPTISVEYDVARGPDGIAGNADDGKPLVLVGTSSRPIVIDGPFIIPSDVIIVGRVSGRGTLYAGRNVHVLGSVTYSNGPTWQKLERDATTGQLRVAGVTSGALANLGTVCNSGAYIAPGGAIPGGCI
jgi:hypothetical protein